MKGSAFSDVLIPQDKFDMILVEVRINHFQIEFVQKVSLDCYRWPAPHMSCQLQIELEKIMQGGEKWETFCQTLHSGWKYQSLQCSMLKGFNNNIFGDVLILMPQPFHW